MHPICALYTPYMHPIWRTYLARARARARPALVDVGPPALTHNRKLNYFHTRARRQMGFFSSLVSIIFHNCGSFFAPKMLKLTRSLCNSLIHDVHLREKKRVPSYRLMRTMRCIKMVEHLLVHVLLLDALRADSLSKFDLKNHIDFQDFA